MIRRTPLKRTQMARKPKAPKRPAWIKPKPRVNLSCLDCCTEAKARARALVAMGCACCGATGPEIHHLRHGTGKGERAPWWRTIPLCQLHHTSGGLGVAVHGGEKVWAWDEEEVLAAVNALLNPEFCGPKEGSA